ncbi:MAG TPA: sulfotransferase [Rhizomicrobium sp.]
MEATAAIAGYSSLEAEVRRLQGLQRRGLHADVLRELRPLLRSYPQNRDLILMEATSLRHMMKIAEALSTLERLEALQPNYSQMHQQRGLCHVALKDAPNAIQAFLRAVNINPALPQSWKMLEGLYKLTGNARNAETAAAHVSTLKALPPEIVSATSLFSDGDLAPAENITRGFLLKHGLHPEAMRLLAKIGVAHDVLDDAEMLLAGALELAPDHRMARYEYADVLVKRHKFAPAREQILRLLERDPKNLDYRALAATAAVGLGDSAEAIAIYRGMLPDAPESPDVHLWLAHALKTIGKLPEAIEEYRSAAAKRPSFGDAYWSLANLKTYRFSDAEIARMREEEASADIAPMDRYHLCFALGKALEDRGAFSDSWGYYERGNALKRAESRYRPEVIETNTFQQIKICTRAFFDARAGWGAPARDPIFIVGLPRSGSTLLEQILASHSEVEGTQELPDVQRMVLEMQGREPDPDNPRYPAVMADMTAEDFRRLGEKYLADTKVYRSGRPVFIDKMPNNFRHIGLMNLMLPNATIIDARREPMSCCFGNLKQLFANGQEFTYSIGDIARYYRTYLELMEHWDAVLPGRVLRVRHEDVVDDLEGSVRRILSHCGLRFEQACVEFHKTERSVRTPSSEQVRQPIFRDSIGQWRNYEHWLGGLKSALGDALVRYRF